MKENKTGQKKLADMYALSQLQGNLYNADVYRVSYIMLMYTGCPQPKIQMPTTNLDTLILENMVHWLYILDIGFSLWHS